MNNFKFQELDSLNNEDLIKVCHGILAAMDSCYGVVERLPKNLSKKVKLFIEKYSGYDKVAEKLSEYLSDRTTPIISPRLEESAAAFFRKIS